MALIKCEKCGLESSDMYESCQHCGERLEKGSIEADSPKQPERKFKWIIIISIICVVIALYWLKNTPITDDQKTDKIWTTYFKEGYDEAIPLVRKYFGTSDKAIAIMMLMNKNANSDIIDDIEIVEQNLKINGNYFDYDVTVKNNSEKTISYIKVNIYFLNEKKEIIHTDWTNWSGTLPPKASTKIDTMIDYIKGVKRYKVEIEEINTK